ncbi:MAG: efflux RND transporter periplasmic adaptor subunit [Muribaculaceae bacterium]|nr:efflux RND transporter periplasmic adaptor subunit [Muribaculaceae bacterium]
MKKTLMQATAVIVTASAAMIITSCSKTDSNAQQQQAQAQAMPIVTETVSTGHIDLNNVYPATIKGKTDIEIRPQVSGFITKVHVDEGQRVHKGQLLFTIDQVQYQAAVDQAQAAVNSAETAVQTAQLTADSKQHLFDRNIISEYENQLAKNTLAQAKAQLATAQAALVSAKKNLTYTEVTAPSDGVIGAIPNREGSLASPSMMQPLTTVSDNSEVYAYFSLNEKDMLKLTNNGEFSLAQRINEMPLVDLRLADGTIYPTKGKVATVSGVIDNTTGTSTVRALFNNSNGLLRSGSTGQIMIPATQDEVIIIPQKATFEQQDQRFVFIVDENNTLVPTHITVAPENDGKNFVVTSGLSVGDRIPVEGVGSKLRPGMQIQPVDAATAAAQAAAMQQAQQQ